ILFVRMATDVGMKDKIKSMGNGKFYLPDGSVRFLLTKEILKKIMDQFGFDFIEPFKSVIVDNERCMSTLMLKKV
ncbi:MAG: class I SAM-dependent methyltransferase, partial [Cyclobacteriaceae bacterium]|nr:class I SAM-dependent methyltransferase [Cyclobacteriaceae bacterium]